MNNYIEEVAEYLSAKYSITAEERISVNLAVVEALTEVDRRAREDWLRSEIEKLERKIAEAKEHPMRFFNGEENHEYNDGYSNALTSIITRYKEELKVLTGE